MSRTVLLIVMIVISIGAVITHAYGPLVAPRFRADNVMRTATVVFGIMCTALATWLLFNQ